MDLTALETVTPDRIEALEGAMLAQEQVECPVTHHFGPGIYIREVFIPAGTLAIGHRHKGPCMNILLKGALRVVVDGEAKTLEAPFTFNSGPGRKIGYALTDCVFQNLHVTDETDLDRLEADLIEKSDTWTAHDAAQAQLLLEGD